MQDVAHPRQVDVDAARVAGAEADTDAGADLAGDARHVDDLGRRARTHQRAPVLGQHVRRPDGVRQRGRPRTALRSWASSRLRPHSPILPGFMMPVGIEDVS